jgi:hypothetical protein
MPSEYTLPYPQSPSPPTNLRFSLKHLSTPLATPRVTRRSAAAAAALANPPPPTPGFRIIEGNKVSTEEADVIRADEQLNREARMAQKSKRARRRARAASRKREAASPAKKAA